MSADVLRLPAPAKLNLMLRIVGRKPDGYHLLQTVFQFIECCDWITLRRRNDGHIRLTTPLPGVPDESDLTVRAARLLWRAGDGRQQGVEIEIEKNLPMGGGLGGGSSDAATTLLGLNKLWSLDLSIDGLAALGLQLGADVPVFIRGYAAWGEGVGENLRPLPDLPEPWYVVVTPPCHVATGLVFSAPGLTRDNKPIKITDFLAGQQENHCLPIVAEMYPLVRDALNDLGVHSERPKLTGTGACVFAAFEGRAEAEGAARELAKRWRVFVARGANISPLHKALALV
ncbi:MAG TPA: 4-(cytidine 5'-diphospho)-2-C-methyl-D-erythritol kinase [Methylococcaceae bacterium]|jgi:4-diphosphocytidyl-2-C-methyl-D-erythritol kinase|nr:4-(cytidine 5'-diphospho)-2-C-methyl-D-erythritol kinase [Methylococcaceae bacterium]